MNFLRRRVMVSKDGGGQLGVFAYYSDGTLKPYAEADTNAIGVAVITKNCSFVIDKTESGDLAFSGIGRDSELVASGIVVTNDLSVAVTDFNGSSNTTKIIEVYSGYTQGAVSGAPTAEYTRTRFNGLGYLGAAGEWNEALSYKSEINSMMSKIGGTQLSLRYWVSTIYPGDSGGVQWRTNFQNNSIEATYERNNTYNMRARAFRPFRLTMEYVDLGLPSGIKWATCNLGATNPEDDGLYYFWGDPVGHAKDSGYSFSADNFNTLDAASLTGDFPATAQYDAAVAALGQPYRVPTNAMVTELLSGCNSAQVWVGSKRCRKFTSKSNGNYIVIPYSGRYGDTTMTDYNSMGYIWANGYTDSTQKCGLRLDNSSLNYWAPKNRGFSIRPVYDPSLL